MSRAENDVQNLIIYRVKNAGVEVFVLPAEEAEKWRSPEAAVLFSPQNGIALEPFASPEGLKNAVAVEADWHEIPSLRALVREDYEVAKGKLKARIKAVLPSFEQGAYVSMKDALRKAAPEQYQFLKELKDILLERNAVQAI